MQIDTAGLLSASSPLGLDVPDATWRSGSQNLPEVAEQFEAVFVSLLLKEMRQTVSEDGLFGGDSADVYGGMFDLFLGQHIASQGSLGIGELLRQQLEPGSAPGQPREITPGQEVL